LIQVRNREGKPHIRRKPKPGRFKSITIDLTGTEVAESRKGLWILGLAMVSGISLGGLWPQGQNREKNVMETFVMEEAIPQPPTPPPELPPPPPRAKAPRVPVPPKQFGLQKEAVTEKSDLAVATGNTVNTKADSIVATPPPPLPPEPVMVDQPPRVVSGPPPEYPARSRDRGIEGTVIAMITIDTTGMVIRALVEKSAGSDLDRSVLKSIWETRFQAQVRNGHRVSTMFRRPYEFRLEG
jgi:periplasmic protein TonB